MLLLGIRDEHIDTLNLLANGDFYHLFYDDIKKIFKNRSRTTIKDKSDKAPILLTSSKTLAPSISRCELGTILEDLKISILHSLSMQMDTIQLKMKREEVEKALAILFHKCRRRHDKTQCPLDVVDVCGIFVDRNPTDKCLFLPPLKSILTREAPRELGEPLL